MTKKGILGLDASGDFSASTDRNGLFRELGSDKEELNWTQVKYSARFCRRTIVSNPKMRSRHESTNTRLHLIARLLIAHSAKKHSSPKSHPPMKLLWPA